MVHKVEILGSLKKTCDLPVLRLVALSDNETVAFMTNDKNLTRSDKNQGKMNVQRYSTQILGFCVFVCLFRFEACQN